MMAEPRWPSPPTRENLVERLRLACQEGREIITQWDHDPHLYDEAADEIERLKHHIGALEDVLKAKTWRISLMMPDEPPDRLCRLPPRPNRKPR